jgi:hypothetical protein
MQNEKCKVQNAKWKARPDFARRWGRIRQFALCIFVTF